MYVYEVDRSIRCDSIRYVINGEMYRASASLAIVFTGKNFLCTL